jgi:hypothetical protein
MEHAFNRFGNQAGHEASTALARQRTLDQLPEKIG